MRPALTLMVLLTTVALAGCDTAAPCDDVHDLLADPAGLRLTQARHPAGWARAECMQCHPITTIHTAACISVDNVDVAAINDELDPEDTTTCAPCHGANGVADWAGEEP